MRIVSERMSAALFFVVVIASSNALTVSQSQCKDFESFDRKRIVVRLKKGGSCPCLSNIGTMSSVQGISLQDRKSGDSTKTVLPKPLFVTSCNSAKLGIRSSANICRSRKPIVPVPVAPLRMEADSSSPSDELWASLRKRIALQDERSQGSASTRSLTPEDIVTLVLRALEENDTPYSNRGAETLLQYSSPFAKRKYRTPQDVIKYLECEDEGDVLLSFNDFSVSAQRWRNGERSCTVRVMIRRDCGAWLHLHFTFARASAAGGSAEEGDRWLIEEFGVANPFHF